MTFDLTAARRGDHWKLNTEERRSVGDALANVLRHVNLPERELGIAADVAALGFVFYAITVPRIEHDKTIALERAGGARVAAGTVPPAAAPPRSAALGDTQPTFVNDADAMLRSAFPQGFDASNPEHVHRLNAIAAGVDANAPIEVSGNAVDPSRTVTGDVHSTPGFFPEAEH